LHTEALKRRGDARHFINEAYKHYKTVGLGGESACLSPERHIEKPAPEGDPAAGVVTCDTNFDVGRFAGEGRLFRLDNGPTVRVYAPAAFRVNNFPL
jgi:hypothetical protein